MPYSPRWALGDAAVLATVTGWFTQPYSPGEATDDPFLWLAVGFVPVGIYLLRLLPGSPLAGRCWAVGTTALWVLAASAWAPTWPPAGYVLIWLPLVVALALGAVFLSYPQPPGAPGARALSRAQLTVGAGTVVVAAAAALPGLATSPWGRSLRDGANAVALTTLACAAAIMLARAHRASAGRHPQRYLLAPLVLLVPGLALERLGGPLAVAPGLVVLPVTLAYGIAVRQLGSGVHVSVLAKLISVVTTFGCYLLVLFASGLIIGHGLEHSSMAVLAVAATALSPALAGPHARLERWLCPGAADWSAMLATIDDRLQTAGGPQAALQETVTAVAAGLQASYAELGLGRGRSRSVARVGTRPDDDMLTRIPLLVAGRSVGSLEIAPRAGSDAFTPHEMRVLRGIGRQVAMLGESMALTEALTRATDQITSTREQERERLRSDLHDGLGPVLAGTRMKLAAAKSRLPADHPARQLVDTAQEDLGRTGATVRELLEDLRPGRLDEGLVPAIRSAAAALLHDLDVQVRVFGHERPASPMAEVTAYRVVGEALTNVARHAGASTCRVHLTWWRDMLHVRVQDDGRGPVPTWIPGVGLSSMSSRAARAGGRLWIRRTRAGSTVHLVVPLDGPDQRTGCASACGVTAGQWSPC